MSSVTPELQGSCTDLILAEAAVLDQRRYDEWLGLFIEDHPWYWIPLREGTMDPDNELNIAYDDVGRLHDRVQRWTSGFAHSQEPPSRTVRSITNFRIHDERPNDHSVWQWSELIVESVFFLAEVRRGTQNLYAGRYVHGIRLIQGQPRIATKKVELVSSEAPQSNLTFPL